MVWRVNEELSDISLDKVSLKETFVGVNRTFTSLRKV
jgi:hypothetical protein